MHTRSHHYPRFALVTAGALLVAALLWMLVGVPNLVKYPTDLDVSPRYEGTFTLFVDPATSATLAEPIELPLTVDRHIEALGGESGASRVLVQETIHQQAGDLVDATQVNVYAMDRSTLKNVEDPRAYAFTPDNVVDRSGAYRLNLPFGTSTGSTYDIYKNEIDATYQMKANTQDPTTKEEGLTLDNFTASVTEAPLSPAYLAELNKLVPLPQSLTLDQLKPQLLAAGLDVDVVLAALTPVITAEDLAALAAVTGEPIPLAYVLSFEGSAGVDAVTGAEVDVSANEAVGARPELTTLPTLKEVLGHYPDVPEAVAAIASLDALAAAPAVTLFEYRYTQTPASVAEVADEVSSMRTQVRLAKVWLPVGLVLAAAVMLGIGTVMWVRRRGTGGPSMPTHETIDLGTPPAKKTEPVGAGAGGSTR